MPHERLKQGCSIVRRTNALLRLLRPRRAQHLTCPVKHTCRVALYAACGPRAPAGLAYELLAGLCAPCSWSDLLGGPCAHARRQLEWRKSSGGHVCHDLVVYASRLTCSALLKLMCYLACVLRAMQEYASALRLYKLAQEKLGKSNKQNLVRMLPLWGGASVRCLVCSCRRPPPA